MYPTREPTLLSRIPLLRSSVALGCLCLSPALASAQDFAAFEQKQLPNLVETYKQIHAHPELSHFEVNTSALVADELRKSGYTVTDHIGVYPDGSKAYGVVGILKNGPGPTLLVRGDMDALPITEETGVPYASHVKTKNKAGQEVGVMEACGHDVHTTVLIGTARTLAAKKSAWHGTLMIVGQPSEETIDGAKAMVADHLFERFGKPDMVIGLHDTNTRAGGHRRAHLRPGHGLLHLGRRHHPRHRRPRSLPLRRPRPHRPPPPSTSSRSRPSSAAKKIPASQPWSPSAPSTEAPSATSSPTRSSSNSLPAPSPTRVARSSSTASSRSRSASAPAPVSHRTRCPTVTVQENESTPVLVNDPVLSARVKATLVTTLGAANVFDEPVTMGSEDVGVFGIAAKAPTVYFRLGAMDPDRLAAATAAGQLLPGLHTSKFEPDPEPTLATGVKSLTAVAVSLLQ